MLKKIFSILLLLHTFIDLSAQTAKKDSILIFELSAKAEYDSITKVFSKKAEEYQLSNFVYKQLIIAELRTGDLINALFYVDKLTPNLLEKNDTSDILFAYKVNAKCNYDLRRLDQAIEASTKISKYLRNKDEFDKISNYIFLGLLYNETDNNEKAHSIYKKIDRNKLKGKEIEAPFYNNLGNIYTDMGEIDSAIMCSKIALECDKRHKKTNKTLTGYSNIAASYIDKKDYTTAIKYLDSTKLISDIDSTSYVYEIIYQNYYAVYRDMRKLDSAFIYLQKLHKTKNLRFQIKLNTEIEELRASGKREIKLTKRVEFADKSLEEAKLHRLLIIIIFLILMIALGVILFLQRFKNLENKHNIIVAEQKLLRSQMTPHFIFNSLSVIQGMILSNKKRKASKYLAKFSKLMRLILENSRNKLVSIEAEIEAMNNYLELQNLRFNDNLNWQINIDEEIDTEILIPPMMIQPFVENSLKHGFKNSKKNCELIINISDKESTVIFIIKDNGIGIDTSPKNTAPNRKSLSTQLTIERLKILEKETKIKSELTIKDRQAFNEKGTIVKLKIPYKT